MSNNNWLELDPKDSPGLQRIREAQQAAALAKTQEAQRMWEAEIAAQEAEKRKSEMLERIEQKTAQVLPLLEEIRDFANRMETYPLGPKPQRIQPQVDENQFGQLIIPNAIGLSPTSPQPAPFFEITDYEGLEQEIKLSKLAYEGMFAMPDNLSPGVLNRELIINKGANLSVGPVEELDLGNYCRILELNYGYTGTAICEETDWKGRGEDTHSVTIHREVSTSVVYGVQLRIKPKGDLELKRQKTVTIPAIKIPKGAGYYPPHDILHDIWKTLPSDNALQKKALEEAFHDPIYLRTLPVLK